MLSSALWSETGSLRPKDESIHISVHRGAMFSTYIHQPEVQSSTGLLRLHRASNMAVNLTDLSLQQLEGLKTQLEQVRNLFLHTCGF